MIEKKYLVFSFVCVVSLGFGIGFYTLSSGRSNEPATTVAVQDPVIPVEKVSEPTQVPVAKVSITSLSPTIMPIASLAATVVTVTPVSPQPSATPTSVPSSTPKPSPASTPNSNPSPTPSASSVQNQQSQKPVTTGAVLGSPDSLAKLEAQTLIKIKKMMPVTTPNFKISYVYQRSHFTVELSQPYDKSLEAFREWKRLHVGDVIPDDRFKLILQSP